MRYLLKSFIKYPQKLINLKITNPQTVMMDSNVRKVVGEVESSLGRKGRVLIRPSGTEPLIRIMVEADSSDLANKSATQLADLMKSTG